jgi:hypothetical protein
MTSATAVDSVRNRLPDQNRPTRTIFLDDAKTNRSLKSAGQRAGGKKPRVELTNQLSSAPLSLRAQADLTSSATVHVNLDGTQVRLDGTGTDGNRKYKRVVRAGRVGVCFERLGALLNSSCSPSLAAQTLRTAGEPLQIAIASPETAS